MKHYYLIDEYSEIHSKYFEIRSLLTPAILGPNQLTTDTSLSSNAIYEVIKRELASKRFRTLGELEYMLFGVTNSTAANIALGGSSSADSIFPFVTKGLKEYTYSSPIQCTISRTNYRAIPLFTMYTTRTLPDKFEMLVPKRYENVKDYLRLRFGEGEFIFV